MEAGRTPYFASTAASSYTMSRRRSQQTTWLPETSWAKSLSEEQMTTCSTPGSLRKRSAADASASSASNSIIGQTTIPKNHLIFQRIERPHLFVVDHLSGPKYNGTVTFDDMGNTTRVTMYW